MSIDISIFFVNFAAYSGTHTESCHAVYCSQAQEWCAVFEVHVSGELQSGMSHNAVGQEVNVKPSTIQHMQKKKKVISCCIRQPLVKRN